MHVRIEDFNLGIDLKWGIRPNLTLDATVNTDFAQVEADEEQVNLTRFDLFFPEKRPFFLENASTFQFGQPQSIDLPLFAWTDAATSRPLAEARIELHDIFFLSRDGRAHIREFLLGALKIFSNFC